MFFPLSQSACYVLHVHVHCRNVFLRSLSPGNVHHESQSSRAVGVTQNSTSHQLVLQSCRRGRNITGRVGSQTAGRNPTATTVEHQNKIKQDEQKYLLYDTLKVPINFGDLAVYVSKTNDGIPVMNCTCGYSWHFRNNPNYIMSVFGCFW